MPYSKKVVLLTWALSFILQFKEAHYVDCQFCILCPDAIVGAGYHLYLLHVARMN